VTRFGELREERRRIHVSNFESILAIHEEIYGVQFSVVERKTIYDRENQIG
jgi:hypothetical protein